MVNYLSLPSYLYLIHTERQLYINFVKQTNKKPQAHKASLMLKVHDTKLDLIPGLIVVFQPLPET